MWKRESERRRHRKKRQGDNSTSTTSLDYHHHLYDEVDTSYCDQVLSSSTSWATDMGRRSLKRMESHLNVGQFQLGGRALSGGGGGSGHSATDLGGGGGGPRKRSSRRRTSGTRN